MTVTVYKDQDANAVFIENSNGVQFLNSLQATMDTPSDVVINVRDLSKGIELFSNIPFEDFVDEIGEPYGTTALEVCNALNAEFCSAGGSTGVVPVITSATTVNLTEGDTLNYELVATKGVGYEWSNLPSGVVPVDGNVRKLIGGSALAQGTYNITAKAINYFGEDTKTISLVVSAPPYSNTRSVQFDLKDYLGANAALLSGSLGRSGNGSGSNDAWSIACWFKPSTSGNNVQTIFYFGDHDRNLGGSIDLKFRGADNNLRFQYGGNYNYLRYDTPNLAVTDGSWHHIFLTYDGGTTGVASGSVSDYYSRFTLFIDGLDVTTSTGSWSNSNYGYSSSIDADNLRVGRSTSGQYMRGGCKVDELAVWGSDQSSNVSTIYNNGTTHDLGQLASAPDHYWRMGDGDTYPNIQDNIGNATFVMYNMTAADIVTDAP